MITVVPVSPTDDDVLSLLQDFVTHVQHVTGVGPVHALELHQEEFLAPTGAFLAARDESGRAIGCGGVRLLDPETAEVKRLWVAPSARGAGAGRSLLCELEAAAVGLGARRAVLDTRVELAAAIRLYTRAGWRQVSPYNDGPATHWFGKQLV